MCLGLKSEICNYLLAQAVKKEGFIFAEWLLALCAAQVTAQSAP